MQNRWQTIEAGSDLLEQLVYQSRLVGADDSLVLWGGGNNSLKGTATDLVGNPLDVMYVKGSGSDMKSIQPWQYPAVRLDYVLPLLEREAMTDEDMVNYLVRCLLDPSSPRPSIETLLHAFVPARAVLHTHADAVLGVCNTRHREQAVRECFGDKIIIVPYLRPGFALSKLVGQAVQENPAAAGILLMNHGLTTWGNNPQEAYDRHASLINQAEAYRAQLQSDWWQENPSGDGSRLIPDITPQERRTWAVSLAPTLRGLLAKQAPAVLEFDDSATTLDFVGRPNLPSYTQIGPATPDHLLYTKRFPLLLKLKPELPLADLRENMEQAVMQYIGEYQAYFARHAPPGLKMLEPAPRIMLVPGLGMWTAGKDARAARIVGDIYRHSMAIIERAESLGGYATLSETEAFNAEYWEMELYKLSLLPKEKDLSRKVALITGAASGIGRAIARRFAQEGAHVVITDINATGAEELAAEINHEQGLRRALAIKLDVTSPEEVAIAFRQTVLAYGGLDILVSNAGIATVGAIDQLRLEQWELSMAINATGHFLVAREALRIMKEQGTGGSIIFNATKNVPAPGKDFGAYSVAKAAEAQLCRIIAIEGGEFGIRSNMLNPDAIFEGSQLWSAELRQQRAQAYGLPVEQLPDFYRQRNLLKAEVTAEDVAEAALWLASARSAKTTGAMLPVDGGIKEAFPR